jgi:hypothetical protein
MRYVGRNDDEFVCSVGEDLLSVTLRLRFDRIVSLFTVVYVDIVRNNERN